MTQVNQSGASTQRYGYHEAGHCIMAKLLGQVPSRAWINGANTCDSIRHGTEIGPLPCTVQRIMYYLAGPTAEKWSPDYNELDGFYSGLDDYDKARGLAEQTCPALAEEWLSHLEDLMPDWLAPHRQTAIDIAQALHTHQLIDATALHTLLSKV